MKQKPIRTMADTLSRSTTAIAGATELGEEAGPKINTAAALTADRTALVTVKNNHEAAHVELKARQSILAVILTTVILFVMQSRDLLKLILGKNLSDAWREAGFRGSFGLPRTVAQAKLHLETLIAYYTAHPTHQREDLNLTAVRAQALLTDLGAADHAVNVQRGTVGDLLEEQNTKQAALNGRLGGLFKELSAIFDPLDNRWGWFGFNKPGAKNIPAVPAGLVAVLVGNNAVSLKWVKAARAEYYRVYAKINGVNEELIAVGSPADLDFTLEGLPAATKVELAVAAVNNGGESQRSEVVTVTTA